MPISVLASVLLLLFAGPVSGVAQLTEDERRMDLAFRLLEERKLDSAEVVVRAVDAADRNPWLAMHGVPERHWAATRYLPAIERMRTGGDRDVFFSSQHGRFHAVGVALPDEERKRIAAPFEEVLDRIVVWAGEEQGWSGTPHRLVFVSIAESFPTPSPARTLIFFWDRQDRAIQMEVTARVLDPRFLTPILAHELTHAVLPHTVRPLAEGMANLAARHTYPDRRSPLRRPDLSDSVPWSLEEVLRFDVRATGQHARRQVELLRGGGFSPEALRITRQMYAHGDDLVELIVEGWGAEALFEAYRATNRDPAEVDLVRVLEERLAPFEELTRRWKTLVGGGAGP